MARVLTVEHPEALTDALRALEAVASESVLRQAAVAGARVIHREAKLRAPVDLRIYEGKTGPHPPGFLRDHIIIAFDDERSVSGLRATYLITWSREAFYGRFVEHGTSKMAAKAFLRPAYDAMRQRAAEAVSTVIQEKVKELVHGR